MKKTSLVFSLVRERSVFMTVVISVLTFLAVLAFGIALAVGGSVIRWNTQWDKYATVQITNPDNTNYIKKVFEENSDKICLISFCRAWDCGCFGAGLRGMMTKADLREKRL